MVRCTNFHTGSNSAGITAWVCLKRFTGLSVVWGICKLDSHEQKLWNYKIYIHRRIFWGGVLPPFWGGGVTPVSPFQRAECWWLKNKRRSQCGKFVGKFINLLHFGAELWENELVWRTGVQNIIYLCTLQRSQPFVFVFQPFNEGNLIEHWLTVFQMFSICTVSL